MLILLCYASVFVLMYLLYSYTVLSLCLKSTSRYWCTVSLNDNEQPFCSLLIHCPCSGGHVAQRISVANSGQCVHIKGRSRSLSAQWRARYTALHPVQLWASPGRWLSRDEGPPTHPLSRFGGDELRGPWSFFSRTQTSDSNGTLIRPTHSLREEGGWGVADRGAWKHLAPTQY